MVNISQAGYASEERLGGPIRVWTLYESHKWLSLQMRRNADSVVWQDRQRALLQMRLLQMDKRGWMRMMQTRRRKRKTARRGRKKQTTTCNWRGRTLRWPSQFTSATKIFIKTGLQVNPHLNAKADLSCQWGILRHSGAPRDTIKCRIYLLIRLRCFWHSGFQSTFSMMGPEFCSNRKGLSQISCRHAEQHAAIWLLQVC